MTIFGTRPEAVKLGPIVRELARHPNQITSKVCVTAQHREMLDQVVRIFGIAPDYDLNVMQDNQTPTQVAATVLAGLEPVLIQERPDWVLVQGDTTTVAVAALAAFYARARVGHVEAGLRTNDRWRPFPEEVNRRIASAIADRHFAPTHLARENLLRENVPDESIVVSGNPVIDALHWITGMPERPEAQRILASTGGSATRTIFVTAHRRESFGQPLENICMALRELAVRFDGAVQIVYPVHRNPNVWEPVHRALAEVPNVILTPPLDYVSNLQVMRQAKLILTDSGGVQEEAVGLGIPGLVLREVTERPEGVIAGGLKLVGTDRQRIVDETVRLLENENAYAEMAAAPNPYGDGHASERIVDSLLSFGLDVPV